MDAISSVPAAEPQQLEGEGYELATLLAALQAKAAEGCPDELPSELPIGQIKQLPELFQPRARVEDERHIQELVRAIKNRGLLDPLLVIQVGREAYLIDGHHRVQAYELAKVTSPVPVVYFKGTVEEAVLEAGRVNTKTKLPMGTKERQDYAWRLVLLGSYSKAETTEAAGVSDGQVAIMRRVKKALGSEAFTYVSWWHAHRKARGQADFEMSDEDRDAWKEALAERYADRIAKACGPQFRNNTEVAAMTLERLFGRRLEELVGDLRGFLPDDSPVFSDPEF